MGEVDEDRAPHHGCDATAEALQKSPGHEHPDVGSEDADERSQGAQHATDDHRNPASLLIGAIFLLVIDDVCRCLLSLEIPLSVATAIIGAPFFIYLLVKGKRTWA